MVEAEAFDCSTRLDFDLVNTEKGLRRALRLFFLAHLLLLWLCFWLCLLPGLLLFTGLLALHYENGWTNRTNDEAEGLTERTTGWLNGSCGFSFGMEGVYAKAWKELMGYGGCYSHGMEWRF